MKNKISMKTGKLKISGSIRKKTTRFISLVALLVMIVSLSLSYYWGFNLLRRTVGEDNKKMTGLLATSLTEKIDEKINRIRLHTNNLIWNSLIRESNTKYTQIKKQVLQDPLIEMDKKWIEPALDTPAIKDYLSNRAVADLKMTLGKESDTLEMCITDKTGNLVASSEKSAAPYQADQDWWKKAYADGKGKTLIENIVFDASKGMWVLSVAVPIRDESGTTIGVSKTGIDIKKFLSYLDNFRIGRTGRAILVNEEGYILFSHGTDPFNRKLFKEKVFQRLISDKNGWMATDIDGKKILIALAKVQQPLISEGGMVWYVLVEQDAKEVYAPLKILVDRQMNMAGILIALVILLGFVFGRILAGPIEKLRGAMVRISGGDIGYKIEIKSGDEVEQLADTFKQMMSNIKNKQAQLVSSGEKLTAAMKAKSYFTSLVSHELRTPLAAIKEGIAIVLDSTLGILNKDQEKCLDIAKKNVDRLTRLINEVLDFQKLESGKVAFTMQENDINEVVNEIHETMLSLTASKGLEFNLELDHNIPRMEFDKDKMVQVLTNIVNNAVKFTKKGSITILTSKGDNYAQVSVKDTGPGINEEDMPRLFQAFEQFGNVQHGDNAGTGLGLVISKDIIATHNGKIWAESKIGQGTVFHIILPVKERRK